MSAPSLSRPRMLFLDGRGVSRVVEPLAAQLGFEIEICSTVPDILAAVARKPASLALIDTSLTEIDGPDLLRQIHASAPDCEVVFEPFDTDRLRQVLNHRRHELARRAQIFELETRLAEETEYHGMIGRSPAMQDIFELIQHVAPRARHVLIQGETGTGKDLAAHAFHQVGPRRAQPLVTVSGSTCPSGFFQSASFRAIAGGTLFLDEIGDLSPTLQSALASRLDDGERTVVIASTNRDLQLEADTGRFRQTLLDRLTAVTVTLPPLRDRREDIPFLTAVFIRNCAFRFRKRLEGVTPAAERLLRAASWAGNVRELRSTIERACMLSTGRLLSDRDLGEACTVSPDTGGDASTGQGGGPPRIAHLGDVEREQIVCALRQVSGNRMAAAKALGISRRALYRRLERYRITEPAAHGRERWG